MTKIIPRDKQKIYYIQWQDAFSISGWLTEKDLEKEINEDAYICEEIGWIVHEDEREIHLVSRRATWKGGERVDEYGLYQRIPKGWIKKKVQVKI